MNFPVWEVPIIGGGMLIGLVAIPHVFVAHLAIGGGLFLPLTELMAYQQKDEALLNFLRSTTRTFVLVVLVFGAVTGVGIWWTIALVHPSATSSLLHIFLFVWATEWVAFLVEIVAALVYYYGWDRLAPAVHLRVGFIYFVSAWISLFLINGILTFMLTPGRWLETRSVWDAFFNPSMMPSLFLRTMITLALAGIFILITSSRVKEEALRHRITKWAGLWLMIPAVLMPPALFIYLATLPESARHLALGGPAPVLLVLVTTSIVLSALIFGFSYWGAYRRPQHFSAPLAFLVAILAFLTTGMTEWVREAIRKPYVIYGYMFSNGLTPQQAREWQGQSLVSKAKFTLQPRWTNQDDLGKEVFRLQCSSCHTLSGYNGLLPLIYGWDKEMIQTALDRLHQLRGFMPPFVGSEEEKKALTEWLYKEAATYPGPPIDRQ
ncbi:MAG: cytochrome ubiquinol oxidase subunit I [Armatimonadetes bacterium]|nr:cytochrome ubiquinol oxidase subunit I [Armatimonadota bacterium]MDW8122508.1 cytochrome ubiquinol oxidase subunit I [Armatimonadota bacterium]